MKDLRERSEKAWYDAQEQYLRHGDVVRVIDVIEAFAIKIHHETLMEAQNLFLNDGYDKACYQITKIITGNEGI